MEITIRITKGKEETSHLFVNNQPMVRRPNRVFYPTKTISEAPRRTGDIKPIVYANNTGQFEGYSHYIHKLQWETNTPGIHADTEYVSISRFNVERGKLRTLDLDDRKRKFQRLVQEATSAKGTPLIFFSPEYEPTGLADKLTLVWLQEMGVFRVPAKYTSFEIKFLIPQSHFDDVMNQSPFDQVGSKEAIAYREGDSPIKGPFFQKMLSLLPNANLSYTTGFPCYGAIDLALFPSLRSRKEPGKRLGTLSSYKHEIEYCRKNAIPVWAPNMWTPSNVVESEETKSYGHFGKGNASNEPCALFYEEELEWGK